MRCVFLSCLDLQMPVPPPVLQLATQAVCALLAVRVLGGAALQWEDVRPSFVANVITGTAHALLVEALAQALLEPENACGAIGIASGLLAGRRFRDAARLASAVRALAPTCFESYRAEMTSLAAIRDHGTLAQVYAAAVAQFGEDERLTPLREMSWYAADDVQAIVASLEAVTVGAQGVHHGLDAGDVVI